MVGLQVLDLAIGVRIPVPQHCRKMGIGVRLPASGGPCRARLKPWRKRVPQHEANS